MSTFAVVQWVSRRLANMIGGFGAYAIGALLFPDRGLAMWATFIVICFAGPFFEEMGKVDD